MENWMKIRKEIADIFPDDNIRYVKAEEVFLITGKTFINDELERLCALIKGTKLWFYLDAYGDKIVIRITQI